MEDLIYRMEIYNYVAKGMDLIEFGQVKDANKYYVFHKTMDYIEININDIKCLKGETILHGHVKEFTGKVEIELIRINIVMGKTMYKFNVTKDDKDKIFHEIIELKRKAN